MEAVTDKDVYAAGELPQLSVALTNTGSEACTIDAGTAQQVFTITSGAEVYWKSTDCQTDKVDAVVLLQPAKTISSKVPITWDRTRSDPSTCQAKRQQVPGRGRVVPPRDDGLGDQERADEAVHSEVMWRV